MGSKRKKPVDEPDTAATKASKQQKTSHTPVTATKPSPPAEATPIIHAPFLEDPRGPHLKRETGLYEQLSSDDPNERLSAADAIVSGLLTGEGVSEATLLRHLERRLFRGLASGRKGARLGFGVVVTEILDQLFGDQALAKTRYTGTTIEMLLRMLKERTKPEGDLSGQEIRDHSLGLLFGLQSFVKAEVLFTEPDRSSAWQSILALLLDLAKKKPWMREECGWLLVEALQQMDKETAEQTVAAVQEAGLAATPEGVGLWLTARDQFPRMQFPVKPWGEKGKPLDHLKELARCLKESSKAGDSVDGTQVKQSGNWNPKLHFVWDIILGHFMPDTWESVSKSKERQFKQFWKIAVDENLFSESASPERKSWGFQLFERMVFIPELLEAACSPNLLRCLINHASKQDRYLNRAATKTLKAMQQSAAIHRQEVIPVMVAWLVGPHGAYNFDKITKTKTIDSLLTVATGFHAIGAIKVLETALVKEDPTNDNAEGRRQVYADHILNMLRHVDMSDVIVPGWIYAALGSLSSVAYCSPIGTAKFAVSDKTKTLFRNRLSSALSHIIVNPECFDAPANLLEAIPADAVPMDEGITAAKDEAMAVMDKLLKEAKKAEDEEDEDDYPHMQASGALALLYSLVIFQLYNGEADAVAVLEELKICHEKLSEGQESGKVDGVAAEILVEILLSFMAKPSMLLRRVGQHVFEAFSGDVTSEGLKAMTAVLESSESLKGQQDLFDEDGEGLDGGDEDEDVDEGNNNDDELDSDVEVVDANENGTNGATAEDDNEEDDAESADQSGEDEADDDEEGNELDAALAKALGTHRLDQDLQATGDGSDSDADMTDSEMLELDTKLVEIFSQRKKQPNKKRENRDARENIVNFKSRVLDLLEIYVKKQASKPAAFDLLLPLLALIRSTSSKNVANKAHGVVSTFATAYKKSKASSESSTITARATDDNASTQSSIAGRLELMKTIHDEAGKDGAHAYARAASTASLLVAASLYREDKSTLKKMATVYRDSMVSWVEKPAKVKVQAGFYVDWVNWCQSHAHSEA